MAVALAEKRKRRGVFGSHEPEPLRRPERPHAHAGLPRSHQRKAASGASVGALEGEASNPPVSVTALSEGGAVVPNTASQGRLMSLMNEGDIAAVPNATRAVVSEMSTGMKVLKVGGRVFLVVGIAATAYDIAEAPPGETGRTAAREVTGFAAGLAAGEGPPNRRALRDHRPARRRGLAFGIAGTYAGSALGEGVYDAFAGTPPSGVPDNGPIPDTTGTVCPNCHAPAKPQGTVDFMPLTLPHERTLSIEDMNRLREWIAATAQ